MSSRTIDPRLSGRSAETKPSNTPGLSQSGALLPTGYGSLLSRLSSWCLRCCCFVSLSFSCFLGFSFVWFRLLFVFFVCSFCLFVCSFGFSAPLWSCFVFCLCVCLFSFLVFCCLSVCFCLFFVCLFLWFFFFVLFLFLFSVFVVCFVCLSFVFSWFLLTNSASSLALAICFPRVSGFLFLLLSPVFVRFF